LGHGPGLTLKADDALGLKLLGLEQGDYYIAPEASVAREKHLLLSTLTQQAHHLVTSSGQRGRQLAGMTRRCTKSLWLALRRFAVGIPFGRHRGYSWPWRSARAGASVMGRRRSGLRTASVATDISRTPCSMELFLQVRSVCLFRRPYYTLLRAALGSGRPLKPERQIQQREVSARPIQRAGRLGRAPQEFSAPPRVPDRLRAVPGARFSR